MTRHIYTDDDARKMVRRHKARPVEERSALLGTLLCAVAGDTEPVYAGVDPETDRPYVGPPVWEDAIKRLVYFAASSHSAYDAPISETVRGKIRWAVSEGLRMADEHRAMNARDAREGS